MDIARTLEAELVRSGIHASHTGEDASDYVEEILALIQDGQYARVQYMYYCNQLSYILKRKTNHKLEKMIDDYVASFS